MKDPKLIAILKTFTPEEMKSFEKFIISPYHNKGRNFKPLLTMLKKLHPEYPPEKLTGEKIYRKIYPKNKYDEIGSPKVIKVLISQLTQIALTYLQVEGFLKNRSYTNSCMIKELRSRQLNEILQSTVSQIFKEQHSGKIEPTHFYDKFLLQNEISRLYVESKNKDVKKVLNLQNEAEESLILFFISRIIDYENSRLINYHKGSKRSELTASFYTKF